jgi:CHAT domain-containing protein
MAFRSGSEARRLFAPLLLALLIGATAAAQPSYEAVFRDARKAIDQGRSADALKAIEEALRRAGDSDEKAVWELRVQRAFMYAQRRNFEEAKKLLARPLPQKLAKTETAARHLIVQAMVIWYQDDRKKAAALLAEAQAIAAKHAPGVLLEVLYRRASITRNVADAKQAARLAKKAGDPVMLVKTEAALAVTYGFAGQFTEAVHEGERVLPQLEKLELHGVRKSLLGNLGWHYFELGDYDRAAQHYEVAIAEARRQNDTNQLQVWGTNLCDAHLRRRDWSSAARHCQTVIDATAKEAHRSRADALAGVSRAYLELGRIEDARRALKQARELEREAEDQLLARVLEARIEAAARNYDAAVKHLLAVGNTTTNAATRVLAASQLAHLYAQTKKNDQAEREFERALSLVRGVRETVKDKELRLFFFNTASELYDNYVDFLVNTGQYEDALRVTETSRAQTLAEELDAPASQKVDAKKIARQRNATILSYWLGRNHSYVWTVTAAGVKLTRLGKNDFEIEKLVEPYQKQLVTTTGRLESSQFAAAGRGLYNLLVAPAAAAIPRDSNVIVVADGKLHMLNFETLIVPAQKPRFWIEDVIVSSAYSLQLLARGTSPGVAAPKMLIVGNPLPADAAFPPLKKAGEEIALIQKRFAGATVLKGPSATPSDYAAARPQAFDYVHFVAHGTPSHTRPLDSAVILGPDKNRNYRLVARDIANTPLTARLVTISSCYGAGSATYAGEGLVGLAWAFLHAGADQVVAALWAVNDSAAPKLMEDMYAGIRSGKEPAVALRDAKRRLLSNPRTTHRFPKFWAPFVVYL